LKERIIVNRYCYSAKTLLTLLVVLLPIGASARGRKIESYGGAIDFGAQLLHFDGSCLSVDGTVKAGNFFEDLKRVDAGTQFQYMKDGKVVAEYPESVTTSIRIMGDQCEDGLTNTRSSIFGADSYALTFEVEWKDGMQLSPGVISPAIAHCVGTRVITNVNKDLALPAVTCQMTVQSKGISLANHLIVSVFSPDGKRLTRLSAAP
jgi:hypothetical protein